MTNPIKISLFLIITGFFIFMQTTVFADTFIVNSVGNCNDGVCNGEHCSLWEALQSANDNIGPDIIHFNIANQFLDFKEPVEDDEAVLVLQASSALVSQESVYMMQQFSCQIESCQSAELCLIEVDSALPAVPSETVINGLTQTGAIDDDPKTPGFELKPMIVLDGSRVRAAPGLSISGSDVQISGLAIGNFLDGVSVTEPDLSRVSLEKNLIGMGPDGSIRGNARYGIHFVGQGQDHLVAYNGIAHNGHGYETKRGDRYGFGVSINGGSVKINKNLVYKNLMETHLLTQ